MLRPAGPHFVYRARRYTLDPVFLTRVETVVNKLLARGATVVLNMHAYAQLDGDAPPASEGLVATELVKPRFMAMWKQIAARVPRDLP